MGFTKEMKIPTIGDGLVNVDSDKCFHGVNALIDGVNTVPIVSRLIGSYEGIELTFLSEVDGSRINLVCDPSQLIYTMQGYKLFPNRLKGELVPSIGKGMLRCIEVKNTGINYLFYGIFNASYNYIDYCYVNGIKSVLFNRV